MAAATAWDPAPWLADLNQIRQEIDRNYPNRDWIVGEREVSLDRWFDRAANAIRSSQNDADARRAVDSLIERFNDGHLVVDWPAAAPAVATQHPRTPTVPTTVAAFCAARGYDAGQVTKGTAVALPGYQAIDTGGPFPAGLARVGDTRIGIVRIGVFSPQGYPALCEKAVANKRIAIDKPCDSVCEDQLLTEAFALMTRGLMSTVERLGAAGAQALLVDLTRNGGGTEWAEVAARILSPLPVVSAPVEVLRSAEWAVRWKALATKLRSQAERATATDRAKLLELSQAADAVAEGVRPCPGTTCSRLARAGFSSGLLAEVPAGSLDGKRWGPDVFSPAQFPYRDSVWKGPLIALVDSETWSAAEQFAALLQDNQAAVIMGTRTGGAGCGHIDGNDPITLHHSGAKLEMPNCVRRRRDGANEVGGIVPDVLTGVRWNDGPGFAGRLTAARFPEALAQAQALAQTQRPR